MSELNPITREEMFLAAASGQNIELPEPITRTEMFLAKIAAGGGTGSGGGSSAPADWNAAEGEAGHVLNRTHWTEMVSVDLLNSEYESHYIEDYGVFGFYDDFDEILESVPETVSVTFDGTEYKDLIITSTPSIGSLAGNLAFMNQLLGTSFDDTGEPFLMLVKINRVTVIVLDTEATIHSLRIMATVPKIKPLSIGYLDIPVLDLPALGLPEIPIDGEYVTTEINLQGLYKIVKNGLVRVVMPVFGNTRSIVCTVQNSGIGFQIDAVIDFDKLVTIDTNGEANEIRACMRLIQTTTI